MLREVFMEESRKVMMQRDQQNMYPVVGGEKVLDYDNDNMQEQGETIVTTPKKDGKTDNGENNNDSPDANLITPVVWQLRYSPDKNTNIQTDEHFKDGIETPERIARESNAREKELMLLKEREEEEERLREEREDIEEVSYNERSDSFRFLFVSPPSTKKY